MTLALAGLEPDDLTDFRRIFGKLRSQLGADWRLVDDADADLTVVDIDSIYGHMDWLKLTGSGKRAAVFTSAQYAKESDLVLFKPLKADNLADILNAVASDPGQLREDGAVANAAPPEAETETGVGTAAEVAAPEPEQPAIVPEQAPEPPAAESEPVKVSAVREVPAVKQPRPASPAAAQSKSGPQAVPEPEPVADTSEPADSIGEWLLRGEFGRPVRIAAGDDVWVVDPDREAYYGPATLKTLGKVLERQASSLEPVKVTTLERARKGQAQPLARLRWYAGLQSSPGKLSPSLAGSARFGLSRWPQIEREFPRHFRIATAMMKQAGSVAELSAASGAPEAEVADFINASHAVGIVEYDPAGGSTGQARGRVMSRLRGARAR